MMPIFIRTFLLIGLIVFSASSCVIGRGYKYAHLPPLINEDFRLDILGFTKTFSLNFKYSDMYSLGITNGNIGFPKDYKFNGKLKLEFFYKDKLVHEIEIEKWPGGGVLMTGSNVQCHLCYKEIELADFNAPIEHRYKNDMILKVTVIRPDTNNYSNDLKIVIGLSPYE